MNLSTGDSCLLSCAGAGVSGDLSTGEHSAQRHTAAGESCMSHDPGASPKMAAQCRIWLVLPISVTVLLLLLDHSTAVRVLLMCGALHVSEWVLMISTSTCFRKYQLHTTIGQGFPL
jgi:hypothetical protein